jgi:hypothetical protein
MQTALGLNTLSPPAIQRQKLALASSSDVTTARIKINRNRAPWNATETKVPRNTNKQLTCTVIQHAKYIDHFREEGNSMSAKRIIMVGTMAVTISISAAVWGDKTSGNPLHPSSSFQTNDTNKSLVQIALGHKYDLLDVLGLSSDEEVYVALNHGKSLADIASEREMDVQQVIDLQIVEMTEQLDLRLAGGSLTPQAYDAQKSELADIITKSVYGL